MGTLAKELVLRHQHHGHQVVVCQHLGRLLDLLWQAALAIEEGPSQVGTILVLILAFRLMEWTGQAAAPQSAESSHSRVTLLWPLLALRTPTEANGLFLNLLSRAPPLYSSLLRAAHLIRPLRIVG